MNRGYHASVQRVSGESSEETGARRRGVGPSFSPRFPSRLVTLPEATDTEYP
ncbi:hypothetical protein OG985_31385 [Streptomyces sp. NBC_00289]|uniref:hypothetical protein n=1 Tax=Streptomyces sp. NBC_00289 TaxID=2975703 RepID=UPI00324B765F